MTPREEAIQLVEKFKPFEPTYFKEKHAKQCALICVDEHLKEIDLLEYDERSLWNDNRYKHWQEVKQEIEKL